MLVSTQIKDSSKKEYLEEITWTWSLKLYMSRFSPHTRLAYSSLKDLYTATAACTVCMHYDPHH